ncbi:unnamed protein product [Thelazia callipaeda]|uniref:Uncharacterized protein n=1 Tax=Thelazia callipaeda TaxID=103827 RepID=A0A3P7K576_THECL|nr:unnamed protein product [Thelazia callipaeda]
MRWRVCHKHHSRTIFQINHWKRVNQLELRKDKLYSTTVRRNNRQKIPDLAELSDNDTDIDLPEWRSKGI